MASALQFGTLQLGFHPMVHRPQAAKGSWECCLTHNQKLFKPYRQVVVVVVTGPHAYGA